MIGTSSYISNIYNDSVSSITRVRAGAGAHKDSLVLTPSLLFLLSLRQL